MSFKKKYYLRTRTYAAYLPKYYVTTFCLHSDTLGSRTYIKNVGMCKYILTSMSPFFE